MIHSSFWKIFLLEFLGYTCFFAMGIMLGISGTGGALLSTPILIYFFNESPSNATHISLLMVCVCSLLLTLTFLRKNKINFEIFSIFAPVAVICSYLSRHFLAPFISKQPMLFHSKLNGEMITLIALGCIMIRSGIHLSKSQTKELKPTHHNSVIILAMLTGTLSGWLGIGGGFVMIPAFSLMFGLDIQESIATSIIITCTQTFSGFLGDFQAIYQFNTLNIISYTITAILGLIPGIMLREIINEKLFKKGFKALTVSIGGALLLNCCYQILF